MENKEPKIVFDTKLMSKPELNCLVEMLDSMLSTFLDKKKQPP